MEKIKLFEFENVSEDLKKIEKERREIHTVLNVTEKILVVLKAIVIIICLLTFINENTTLLEAFLRPVILTTITLVFFLFCDGVEEKIRRIRRTLRKGK
ncbi:hypothetical protein [Streptobacillus moniliformis]|uniref:hypothetical protein n=1 Tax=Streptobacillus moniliformis TaxID=34105 RepID=UPI0007E44B67|nr:hypothetical protein [Streptobacillus moniliformis]